MDQADVYLFTSGTQAFTASLGFKTQRVFAFTYTCGTDGRIHICGGTVIGRGYMPLIFSHLHLLDLYQPKTFFKGGGGVTFLKFLNF